jgi:hypothetical protein
MLTGHSGCRRTHTGSGIKQLLSEFSPRTPVLPGPCEARMIRHVWTVVCARSSIDSESNNISLFDVLEQLTLQGPLPEGRGQLAIPHEIVSLWTRERLDEGATGESRIKMVAPSGWTTEGRTIQLDLTRFNRLRTRGRPAALPVEGSGLYWIVTEFRPGPGTEWQEVARAPLELRMEVAPAE